MGVVEFSGGDVPFTAAVKPSISGEPPLPVGFRRW